MSDRTETAVEDLCVQLDEGKQPAPALLARALRALHDRIGGVATDGSALHARVTSLESARPGPAPAPAARPARSTTRKK